MNEFVTRVLIGLGFAALCVAVFVWRVFRDDMD